MMIVFATWLVFVIAAVMLAITETFWPISLVLVLAGVTGYFLGREEIDVAFALLQWYYIAPYFLIGLGWVFFKWTRFVEKQLKNVFMYAGTADAHRMEQKIPKWTDHWDEFAGHFFYWPLSIIAYIFHDLLFNLWELVAKLACRTFDRYAEWRFNSLKAKLVSKETE